MRNRETAIKIVGHHGLGSLAEKWDGVSEIEHVLLLYAAAHGLHLREDGFVEMIVLSIGPPGATAEKEIACFAGPGQRFLNERSLYLGRSDACERRAFRRRRVGDNAAPHLKNRVTPSWPQFHLFVEEIDFTAATTAAHRTMRRRREEDAEEAGGAVEVEAEGGGGERSATHGSDGKERGASTGLTLIK